MIDQTQAFYDGLAEDYHLVYADWEASIRRQAAALDRLIRTRITRPEYRVLDCTCGVGTQALGLAALGYRVTAADLSPRAIERARREARRRLLDIQFVLADLRTLSLDAARPFDVVLSADNALPHFVLESDLRSAVERMVAHLEPGGLFVASIRDYDSILEDPPHATPPVVTGPAGERCVTFQLWNWDLAARIYELEVFVLRENPAGAWRSKAQRARYRAIRRSELNPILTAAGLESVKWAMPETSGFFQPVVTGYAPD